MLGEIWHCLLKQSQRIPTQIFIKRPSVKDCQGLIGFFFEKAWFNDYHFTPFLKILYSSVFIIMSPNDIFFISLSFFFFLFFSFFFFLDIIFSCRTVNVLFMNGKRKKSNNKNNRFITRCRWYTTLLSSIQN